MGAESVLGYVFAALVMGAILWAIGLIGRACRGVLLRSTAKGAPRQDALASAGVEGPAWRWLLLILGYGFIMSQFISKPAVRNPPPGAISSNLAWIGLLLVGVTSIVAFIAFRFLRGSDSGVRLALKRADEGDPEGAIDDLREQMEEKGASQDRVNALGILLLKSERWDEAAAAFRKAEELGAIKGVCRANLGLALLKGGKPDEALPVLEEAARISPRIGILTCMLDLHTALALAALGRWDEARECSRVVEEAAANLSRSQLKALTVSLEQMRTALSEAPPTGESLDKVES